MRVLKKLLSRLGEFWGEFSTAQKLVSAIMLTLPLKLFWKFHPDAWLPYEQVPYYKMYPFSDVMITVPNYLAYGLDKIIWLIWIAVACKVFAQFKALQVLFVMQALIFVEYFFNYNEAYFVMEIFGDNMEVGLFTLKLYVPCIVFIIETVIWKRR